MKHIKKGPIPRVVGFQISPKGNSENAGPLAMLISSLRIKFSPKDNFPSLISSLQIRILSQDDSSSLISSLQIRILSQG